jgi:hypothetical protein
MVEEDELELKLSRFGDFRGMGDDLHAIFCRSEAGRQEFGFSLLLNNADATGAEGNEPSIMAESGNSDPGRLGSFENRRPLRNFYSNVIDLQFDGLIRHDSIKFLGVMECWSTEVLGLILIVTPSFHYSVTPTLHNFFYSMALNLHAWIHDRHRMHFSKSMAAGAFFSQVIASVGHAFLQRPHFLHFSASTRN